MYIIKYLYLFKEFTYGLEIVNILKIRPWKGMQLGENID